MRDEPERSSLRFIASLALFIAAIGSLASMFIIGSRQKSLLLIAMFLVWVLSPYVALAVLDSRARAWHSASRVRMRYATVLISLMALGRYMWVVIWPLEAQPASTFLIVPFISWIAIAVTAALTRPPRSA